MNTVRRFDHLGAASSMKCKALSVGCTTERNYPGPAVPSNGAASSQVGGELVAGLLLILLLVVVLVMPFEALIPLERNGKASSRSTCTDSTKKKRSGGTEKEPYE